jgi:hypothetical protein
MTAHNLRRRKLAEAQARERARAPKAALPRDLTAELEAERARNATLARELTAAKAANAELEEALTAPQGVTPRREESTPRREGDALPRHELKTPSLPRSGGRGRG